METRINHAPPIYRTNKKKKNKVKLFLYVFASLVLAYLALFLLIVPERPDKPFFNGDKPFVIAHRGGAALAPENTLIAFEKAKSLGVDVIEYDIHLTKDGHIVVIHDETVNRTTNGEGQVAEMTLQEIKQLDAAYTFKDIRGRYIYRGQQVTIPTIEEVFQQFPGMRHNIEIKTPSDKEEYVGIEQKLWETIEKYNMQDKVLVASYSDTIMNRFKEYAQNRVAVAAAEGEARKFALYHKTFMGRLFRPQSDALQLPTHSGIFQLTDQRLINGANTLNMPIYYWTINDEEEMRALLSKGAKGIITDRPDLLIRVMNEMGDFKSED